MGQMINISLKEFERDPGLSFAGTAQTRRDWDQPNDWWDANFILDLTAKSKAYYQIDPNGQLPADWSRDWKVSFRMSITAAVNGGQGFVGWFDAPADVIINAGMAIAITAGPTIVLAARVGGVGGPNINIGLPSQTFDIEITWDVATTTLKVQAFTTIGALIGTSTVVAAPAGAPNYFGTMDGLVSDTPATTITGYMDDVAIEVEVEDTDWVLVINEDEGFVIFDKVGLPNKDQPPIFTIIPGQGRPWSSRYWDGAGPMAISINGTLYEDRAILDAIHETVLPAYSLGKTVVLNSPITKYTIEDGEITLWSFPYDIQRVNNRDFTIIVGSRRAPQIS